MPAPLVSRREAAIWAGCFVVVSILLVVLRFTSDDPDSDLYAGLSARLSEQPVSRWIAPEWWGLWPRLGFTGLYRDHPIGGFVIPALLARLGIPGEQAAYIVGVGAGLAALLLVGHLVEQLTSRADARAVLVLLQLMPVAFVFRIRANQEYAMLVCLIVTIIGLDWVRQSWRGFGLVAVGLMAAMLIKGVFVVLVVIGAALWVILNPSRSPGPIARPVAAGALSLAPLAAVAVGYDAWYRQATGEGYWLDYWRLQLGQVSLSTPIEGASTWLGHLTFYLIRLLWHSAPWSLALIAVALQQRTRLVAAWRAAPERARQGLLFALLYAALLMLTLSPSSRVAERYIFSATHAVAAAGIVVACRSWPHVARTIENLDLRIPALPALVWFTLIVTRLAVGPWLTRI